MLQLDSLRAAANTEYSNGSVKTSTDTNPPPAVDQAPGSFLPLATPLHAGGAAALPPGHDIGAMIHWGASAYSPPQQPLPSQQQTLQSQLQQQQQQQQQQQHQQQSQQQQQQQSSGVAVDSEEDDDEYRPFTPPPPRERLSYTRYQLELLNGIFLEVRYPNSTQKQLIAKRVGITREQVKIWFQNRRRKDVVTKTSSGKNESKDGGVNSAKENTSSPQHLSSNDNSNQGGDSSGHFDPDKQSGSSEMSGTVVNPSSISSTNSTGSDFDNPNSHKSTDSGGPSSVGTDATTGSNNGQSSITTDSSSSTALSASSSLSSSTTTSSQLTMVSPVVLRSIVAELGKFNDEYLKLKKNKKKKNKRSAKHISSAATGPPSALSSCKAQRLFQSYDMIAPPNKVTPSAFLNTSVNRFKHASGTSAFQNPRENRVPLMGLLPGADSRPWEGLSLNPSLPGSIESSDLLQQRSSSDLAQPSLPSTFNFPSPAHQSPLGTFLPGSVSHSLSHPQSPLYDNIPVLSDLLGSYKPHPSSATAVAAAAAAQRQFSQSLLSPVQPAQSPRAPAGAPSYFHLPSAGGGSSNASANSDSGKSPSADLPFPPAPSHFSLHHPHASHFALNRVFPFPLIADPPVVLSTMRQSDTFRPHPSWPTASLSPHISSAGCALPPVPGGSTVPVPPPGGSSEDPYRPLMISSLSNPYFSPPSATYSLTTLPPPPSLWSLPPPSTDSSGSSFQQL